MKKTIGFATGSIWQWLKTNNRNELINHLKQLDIRAIELTIGSKEELDALTLSDENIIWMKELDHVSIHAPAFHTSAPGETELHRQLDTLEALVSQSGASTVVLHTKDIPPAHVLKSISFPLSIENTGIGNYTSPETLEDIFSVFPDFKFCLDVSHAALISDEETALLISRFRNKISHVHLSGTSGNMDHQSLIGASPQFYKSLIPAIKLDVPFLIEEDIREQDIKILHRELLAADNLLW